MECLNLSLFSECDDDWSVAAGERIDDVALAAKACEAVPGLGYFPDYIDRDEEQAFLRAVDAAPWSSEWQRRTQHYGRSYLESQRKKYAAADEGEDGSTPLPEWIWGVRDRLVADNVFGRPANQMGINEYLPGQGIAGHVDYHGGEVVSITLGTGCVMDFHKTDGSAVASMWLAPRSMVALKAEARSLWTHGIRSRKTDVVDGGSVARGRRVSVTLRCILYPASSPPF